MLQPVDIASGLVSGVDDLSAAASSIVNWEADEAGVGKPRPGLASYTATNMAAASLGLHRWQTFLVNVTSDGYVRTISDGNPATGVVESTSTTSTQVTGSAVRATFASGDQYVYMARGGQIVRWQYGGAPSTLTSSPAQVTHVSILGQRLIANDLTQPSALFWSEAGEGAWTSWPTSNATNAEARPDPIRAHAENTSEVFVWGTETLQVFAVGADPTLPFDPISTVNVGLGAPYAFTRMDEAFAFLDDKLRIVISDGRSITPIGDAIQKTIRGLSTISDCWMYREERGQMSLLVVRFPTARRTFVYDLKGQKWTGERSYYSAPFNTADWPVGSYAYWPPYRYHMFGSTDSGLARLDEDSRQDLGGPLVSERVGGWNDFGSRNRKRLGRVRATMRRGLAAQGATPGALEVRAQFDDSPWSPWEQLSLGAPEDYKQYAETFALAGIARRARFAHRFSNTEAAALEALHVDVVDLEAA